MTRNVMALGCHPPHSRGKSLLRIPVAIRTTTDTAHRENIVICHPRPSDSSRRPALDGPGGGRRCASIGALLAQGGPPTPALAHLDVDKQGFAWLPEDDFVQHFAADVDAVAARVMHAVQQPLSTSTFQDVMGVPAWKSCPSWFLVAEDDQAIPPEAERQFAKRMGATTVAIASGHLAMVSHPGEVAQLIKTAAEAVPVAD
jgi:pimeloyl-ACP methyl ester carboxylesterase